MKGTQLKNVSTYAKDIHGRLSQYRKMQADEITPQRKKYVFEFRYSKKARDIPGYTKIHIEKSPLNPNESNH